MASGWAYNDVMDQAIPPQGSIAVAIGPISAIVAAGLMSRFRDSFGVANVVLVLAVVVIAAAFAGRVPGILTAITAALSFNFFHAEPYQSLRIHGAQDIVTVVMLGVLGVAMSEFSAGRRRVKRSATRRLLGARALETVTAMLAAGAPPPAIWEPVRQTLIDELSLVECRFEAGPTTLPMLPRSAALVGPHTRLGREGFMLPADGIAVPVVSCGNVFGHIVMVPDPQRGSPLESRQLAIALADDYAIALGLQARSAVTPQRR